MAWLRRRPNLLFMLALIPVGAAAEPVAEIVAGVGTRIETVDGRPIEGGRVELTPGEHRLAFHVHVEAKRPGMPSRWLYERCEARFHARPGARYAIETELVSIRGERSWRHLLSSGVLDEERGRWIGECVCRVEDPPGDVLGAR